MRQDADFTAYVAERSPWLRRVAFLLCQDWHRADDLVQTAATRLYMHWGRVKAIENIDGYARTVLVRTYLAEQRTSWWKRVTVTHDPPDPGIAAGHFDVGTDLDLQAALMALPPRQRAAVVLRYYCDLPITETAAILKCSTGTVKSQTSKGLEALRRLLSPAHASKMEKHA